MIKKALGEFLDCSFQRYVKIRIESELSFLFKYNNVGFVKNHKSSFLSRYFNTKFHRPKYEIKWQATFEFDNRYMEEYISKLCLCMRTNIAEFGNKLLNGISNNNLHVSKWNKDVNSLCEHCLVAGYRTSSIFHLKLISLLVGFEITRKILNLGF